jgi:hypothetical protein
MRRQPLWAQEAYEAAHQLEQMGKSGQLQRTCHRRALEHALQSLQSALRDL